MSETIHLLHENLDWVVPLQRAIEELDAPVRLWDLAGGVVRLDEVPPGGVYYCRMSASAHTRGHHHAGAYAAAVLAWLEMSRRRVVNGTTALSLELSKVRQYAALRDAGIPVPRTRVAVGPEAAAAASEGLAWPVVVKPSRGGKGLGVVKLDHHAALVRYVASDAFDAGPDGTVLVQEYITPRSPHIIRNEFVAGRHLYSVRVDTSAGFELCPADACVIPGADDWSDNPIGDGDGGSAIGPVEGAGSPERFEILTGFEHPLIAAYESLLARHRIEIAGIEMIEGRDGVFYTYDVNVNTNYNREAEGRAGLAPEQGGMGTVARFLHRLGDLEA